MAGRGRPQRIGIALLAALLVTFLAFVGIQAALGSNASAGAGGDVEVEWALSGHANEELAKEEASVEARQAGTASCARCHASQGFALWVDQLGAGNPGNLVGPDGKAATVDYMASVGLTHDQVRPVDCQACHTETYELRVSDSTPMLPSGFAALGVGDGALCMTCHNTRNGRIAWDAADAGRYTAPHHSAQADVIMGQNVYFVDYSDEAFVSPHAAFTGDSCVTCHKDLSDSGHQFKASPESCSSCHGQAYTAKAVEEPLSILFQEVAQAYSDRFVELFAPKVTTIAAWNPDTDETKANTPVVGSAIAAVELEGIHGQQGLKITMKDGSQLYSQLGQVKGADGKPVVPTTETLVKAGWNYLLLLWDGSKGIHNPSFTRQVLLATLEALNQRP